MRAARVSSALAAVLAVALSALLSVDVAWCDAECVERAHPISNVLGLAKWGSPEATYTFTLSARSARVHRVELVWGLPVSEQLEVMLGPAVSSDGRFEVVPGGRWWVMKAGFMMVPAVALSAPLAWRQSSLEIHVRPALELHVGLAAMMFGVELDVAGRAPFALWSGFQLGL